MFYLNALATILLLMASACGNSEEKTEEGSSNAATVNSQRLQVLISPEITPPVEANTPDAFKSGFSLMHLAKTDPQLYLKKLQETKLNLLQEDASTICAAKYERDSAQFYACKVAYDVKDRYFSGIGPTDLASLTSKVDDRMSGIFRNSDRTYMPCFDEKNTEGGSYVDYVDSTETTLSYPKFSQFQMPSEFTFEDAHTFDHKMTAYLSCYSSSGLNPAGGTSWVGYGRKDGDYYIHEGQSAPGVAGSLSKSSANGDVELYFTVGLQGSEFPSTIEKEYANYDKYGAGLIHMKSFAETGFLELTSSGMGLSNAGCSTHMLTNGKMMYVVQNENSYGACTATDTGIGFPSPKNDNTPLAYDASKIKQEYCLNVSESTSLSAYSSLEPCTDAGLNLANLQLTTLTRSMIRGSHALYMFNRDLSDSINPVQFVPVDTGAEAEGSASMVLPLATASEANNMIETACNTASANEKTVALSYKLDFNAALESLVTEASTGKVSPDFNAEEFKAKRLKELSDTTGSKLKFTVSASAGGVKWADFALSLTATLDGNSVGSASYLELSDHVKGAQVGEFSIDLTGVTASSSLELTGTGTLTLGCTNQDVSSTGTATLRVGYPRLVYEITGETK